MRLLTAVLLGVAGLTLASCEDRKRLGPWAELVRFDFEEQDWTPHAERRESAASSGTLGGYLDGGFRGSKTFSPLIPLGDWDQLEVTWKLRIDQVGQRGFRLFLHGYEDLPSPHAAIPDLPVVNKTLTLGIYEGEQPPDWQGYRHLIQRGRFEDEVSSVRFEWRIYSPRFDEDRDSAAFAFDDIVIRARSRS